MSKESRRRRKGKQTLKQRVTQNSIKSLKARTSSTGGGKTAENTTQQKAREQQS